MREYLTDFFKDFGYDTKDSATLLYAYDRIAGNNEASKLLSEALTIYCNDIKTDYKTEILGRSKGIAELTEIHPYTADLSSEEEIMKAAEFKSSTLQLQD